MGDTINFDYYYGIEAEQFSFYRVPRLLIKDERFKGLSSDAKLLYGLMLDRMSLSMKNGWLDDENRAYIIYTVDAIMEDLGCASLTSKKCYGGANMCITEEKLVEAYGNSSPHERFLLIYKNYSVFPQLVDCYETGLFNRILFEVEYNRRKKNDDDLGVRVQTSHRSDSTAAKAIEHIMIRDAIEECNFSGNILKETDTPEKHKHDILTIHMMRREFEVFDSALKALPTKEHDILFTFINKERKMLEIAEDRDLAYQTVKNLIGDIKKLLESRTVPYFRETL